MVLALEIGIPTSEIWKVFAKGSWVMGFGYQSYIFIPDSQRERFMVDRR